jgi:hypothetical protein
MLAHAFSGMELHFDGWTVVLTILALLAYLHVRLDSTARQSRVRKCPSLADLRTRVGIFPATPPEEPGAPNPTKRRRSSLRREGNPVGVVVSTDLTADSQLDGLVTNRSRGGVLLSLAQPFAVNTYLNIRAAHAPDDADWIRIEVRHCKQQGERWLLGCAFKDELPWGVLLLFG